MKIQFSRSGGFTGIRLKLTLDLGELSPKDRNALEALVRKADFFTLPASCLSLQPDAFQYEIAVEGEGQRHQVQVDDRGAPEALRPLLERLGELARARALSQRENRPPSPESKQDKAPSRKKRATPEE